MLAYAWTTSSSQSQPDAPPNRGRGGECGGFVGGVAEGRLVAERDPVHHSALRVAVKAASTRSLTVEKPTMVSAVVLVDIQPVASWTGSRG